MTQSTEQQPLTVSQMEDALNQLHVHCDLALEDNYRMICVRGSLHDLGFHGADCDQIMQAIYNHGFTYCFDPSFPTADGHRVSADVCYWGPDQLKSRLPRTFWKGI